MKVEPRLGRRATMTVAFVVSGALLAYEVLLTRVASVLLTSQFLFVILSVSLLGIAVGAIADYGAVLRARSAATSVGVPLGCTAIALVAALLLALKIGPGQGVVAVSMATALPFACSGFLLARLFRLNTERSGPLYAADLTGAATGALVAPAFLAAVGPVQSIVILAASLGLAAAIALFLERRVRPAAIMTCAGVALIGLAILNRGDDVLGDVPVGRNPDKDYYRMTSLAETPATIVESRWSSFGRTDLVRFGNESTAMSIFVDGAAGSAMLRFDGDFSTQSPTFRHATSGFGGMAPLLALDEDQKDEALIIGPGGGRDVLLALMAGIEQITAVDVNPQMVELVRDYGDFNGNIYTDYSNVRVLVDDGRRFLRRDAERYDVILLFMPITKSSRGLNAFALSESYLFTLEALRDYHDHLTDEGTLLIMAHSMLEATKLTSTAVAALEDRGLSTEDAMAHVFLLGSDMMPLFGLQKTAVSAEMAEALHEFAHFSYFDCRLSFIPGVRQELQQLRSSDVIDRGSPMMSPLFIDIAEGRLAIEDLRTGLGYNLVPASDDRPYFFQYSRRVPGVVTMILAVSLALLALVVFGPARRMAGVRDRVSWWLPAFFAAIGFGYVVVELGMIQQIVFHLGDPSRTLALLLAGLLLGSGIGSVVSRRSKGGAMVVGGVLTAALVISLLFMLPALFGALHEARLGVQQAVAVVVLLVLGAPMGMMLPVGLRVGERTWGHTIVPWMWAVNGVASVAGGALAVGVAMAAGTRGHSW